MVCILDSTINFKEMHKLKLYAGYKGKIIFSFMERQKARKTAVASKAAYGMNMITGTFKL